MASRDILPGEEITITYIDPLQKRQARQAALYTSWGFNCDCRLCLATSEAADHSDARIDIILQLQEELVDRTTSSLGSLTLAKKLICLIQQEQLWTLIHEGYFAAAIESSGIGDAELAKQYAIIALQSRLSCRGAEVVDDWDRDMLLLRKTPERHPSWKFRISK